MKFTIERSYLLPALTRAKTAISARSTIPVLSHFYFDAQDSDTLTIVGTDLDTAVKVTLPYSSIDAGDVALPAATLLDYVNKLPDGPITFELSAEGKMILRSGKSRYTVPSAPGADFPVVPEVERRNGDGELATLTIGSARLKEMLRLTTFAASKEESRSLLMGVLIEARGQGSSQLNFVATDTHRLARMSHTLDSGLADPICSVIPAKPLTQLVGMLPKTDEDVTVTFSDRQVQFQFGDSFGGDTRLLCRVLDGQYPNYEKVIPQKVERTVLIEREELASALSRIDIVSRTASQKVLAKFEKTNVTLSSESPDSGQTIEELPIENDGDDLTIAFNAKYLLEVMGLIPDENIELRLQGSLQPGIIYGDNGFSYVVMPMQA